MVLVRKDGTKLYPVCSFVKNQHKLYNAHDRIMNALDDAYENGTDKQIKGLQESLAKCERAMTIFDCGAYKDGLVYAPYKDGQIIKDFIWAYNARH